MERKAYTGQELIALRDLNVKTTTKKRTIKLAKKIMQDQRHPLNRHYQLLPSGRRLSISIIRTARFKRTFIPLSIISINSCGQTHPFGH
jgi:hypothetical protein